VHPWREQTTKHVRYGCTCEKMSVLHKSDPTQSLDFYHDTKAIGHTSASYVAESTNATQEAEIRSQHGSEDIWHAKNLGAVWIMDKTRLGRNEVVISLHSPDTRIRRFNKTIHR